MPTYEELFVEAPFEMLLIKIPDFSKCKSFYITDFGALEGDKEKTSSAIEAAIEKAVAKGGGRVVIPPGEWLTGKIHFKSNINLHLEKGAVLLFSDDPADYLPAVQTTWEGIECYNYSPLIYAYECQNIAITGEGELRAKMDVWQSWSGRPQPHMETLKRLYHMGALDVPVNERVMVNDTANLRPQFIQFNRSSHILLEGVTITNSPFWVIHPFMANDVVIRDVKVKAKGHNNDGVDPEMSRNVLIENCIFDQGDDMIAIKAGRNRDAWRLNTPSQNIVVRNCTMINGHQLLAIGSELSGGIENVFVNNISVVEDASLFHLVFIKTNERRGGVVKNIFVENINANKTKLGILGIETDVMYQWRDIVPTYERRLTRVKDVFLTNVHASEVEFISRILGEEELPVNNVVLKDVSAVTINEKEHIHENVVNFNFD